MTPMAVATNGLREQLQAIYDTHGKLTPSLVVNEARDPDHPLHDRFEWNYAVAAEAWRREQAHELVRSVRIVYRKSEDGPEKSVRAFHALRSERGYVYEPADKVVENPLLTRIVLADMRREWETLRRRYGGFREFAQMVRADLERLES